ncbi:MAG: hypothetical protein KDC33_10845 [Thermoleophilia bacterium]|nr:hypothetical protein [Thermoleophilia bacterium]
MALAPGTYVTESQTVATAGAPTSIGTWFVVGATDRGPIDRPVEVRSLDTFRAVFGDRVAWSMLYDSVEAFFQLGGARMMVSRVVGPSPTSASKVLNDAGAAPAITVSAANPGAWGAGLSVQVVAGTAGGSYVLVVTQGGVEVERSPDLVDNAAAATWALGSSYIRVAATGANDPAVAAAAALVGGDDAHTGIVTQGYTDALARFTRDLGPGFVSAPGVTTTAIATAVTDHAVQANRAALLDAPDTATVATITGYAASVASVASGWRGMPLAPWTICRGVAAGTTRRIPPSATQAAAAARATESYPWGAPPPAGDRGKLPGFAIMPATRFTDAERGTLNDAGVTVHILQDGAVTVYGDVGAGTGVWRQYHGVAVFMALRARLEHALKAYVFATIDGAGLTQAAAAADLRAICLAAYNAGVLYGATPEQAFTVDASDGVNTPATKAAGDLRASVSVVISPVAERVTMSLSARQAA